MTACKVGRSRYDDNAQVGDGHDVQRQVEVRLDSAVKTQIRDPQTRNVVSVKSLALTRIQKLVGERMLLSKRTKPCFYLQRKADVTELMADRHKLSKALGVKITSNAFLIRALAIAAHRFPLTLGRLTGPIGRVEPVLVAIPDQINVGFAVNSAQGLMVPVIQQANVQSLAQIAQQEQMLTRKARSNKLTLEDIEGETIALSNLGAYDIHSFFGIVPPLTSTILSVGNVIHAVVPVGSGVAVRKMMSLSLAVDRRVIDESYAARFLQSIVEPLQDPERLI
jgi:pyruvate dehydrogenase E2 component (dihydrolipoamide acetyltransferase)